MEDLKKIDYLCQYIKGFVIKMHHILDCATIDCKSMEILVFAETIVRTLNPFHNLTH